MRNNTQNIRILSPDYIRGKERLEKLHEIIVDGKDAEAVLKYADRFIFEIERETLEALKKPNADHKEAADFYRAACRFADMVRGAVALGRQKTDTFERLKAER